MHREGIKFQGLRYFSTTLAGFVGQEVLIRYDPRDMAEIHVFYNDKFLCRAISQDLDTSTVSLKEIIAARNQRKRELQKNIKNRRSLVDVILHGSEVLSENLTTVAQNHSQPLEENKIKKYEDD